jgi:hypothetical protein
MQTLRTRLTAAENLARIAAPLKETARRAVGQSAALGESPGIDHIACGGLLLLHCIISVRVKSMIFPPPVAAGGSGSGQFFITEGAMSTTWKTKWGARRVRKDPPTIEEALIAAESLTDDLAQRIEIAAALMGASPDEVRALASKQASLSRGRSTLVNGRNRAVVVEYKRPRTVRPPAAAPARR